MDCHYSTLELVKNDETARAPERDYDATAFELDASALAPQAVLVPDTSPQVLYNTSPPWAHEESTEEKAPSHHTIKPTFKWPWLTIALVVAAAIAIGVSVGIWRHRKHSSHKSSAIISPSATQNHSITSAAQFILNDTSLAALSLPNGDRQLFFQDNTGLIQRAIRTASNGQWSKSANQNLSFNSNPKIYTPLAVTYDVELAVQMQITLYYVSESHVLSLSSFSNYAWASDSTLGNYSTAVDTRSLSITSIGRQSLSSRNSTTNSALLYYENSTGKVSALLQRVIPQTTQYLHSQVTQWADITSQNSKSLPDNFRKLSASLTGISSHRAYESSNTLYESDTNATFGTPFTSQANWTGSSVGALFYSPPNAFLVNSESSISSDFIMSKYDSPANGTENFIFSGEPFTTSGNYTSIHQSDIALFSESLAMWINGTQPAILYYQHGSSGPESDLSGQLPNNTFPFARLASVTLADQSATFLYHQINGTTFAEEQYDVSLETWLPSVYITVTDS